MINNKDIAKRIDEGLQILKQKTSFIFNLEEIEAIKRLETKISFWEINNIKDSDERIILNLIDKLQRENEKLKDDKEGLINGYKDTADKLEELRAKYNELQKELNKSNKRIDMCIDLLNGEGCLNFDTKQEKLDYIDKLIKLEVEDEKK